MSDFVTLKTFPLAIEAEMLRGRLEADGIRCFLQGDKAASVVGDINRINTSWSRPLGGTQLLVHSSDWQRAQEILELSEPTNSKEKLPSEARRQAFLIWIFWLAVASFVVWFLWSSAFSGGR